MSESDAYIIVVSSGKEGVKVYTLKTTMQKVKDFWDWWKGRKSA